MECWNVKKWSKMHNTICYLYIYYINSPFVCTMRIAC